MRACVCVVLKTNIQILKYNTFIDLTFIYSFSFPCIYITIYHHSQLGLQHTLTASLQSGNTLPKSVLDMTLNHLMATLQHWRLRECGVLLHCHCSHVSYDQRGST